MRLLPTLALSLLALSPAMGQESRHGIPVTKTGTDAADAFHGWVGGLDLALTYPVQLRLEFEMEADMEFGMQGGFGMDFDMDLDILLDSADAMRSWGDVEVEMGADGERLDWDFDFQYASDSQGLRFLLDDKGALKEELGVDIPRAFSLSPDRLKILMDSYGGMVVEMINTFSPHGEEPLADLEHGLHGLFHPVAMTQMMAKYPGIIIVGWGTKDGKVLVQTQADWEMIRDMMPPEMMPFDVEIFRELVYEIVIDQETGALLEYVIDLELPMDMDVEQGMHMTGEMALEMSMRSVPVSTNAPSVTLPDASQVMNLDEPFDQYWPMIEMIMEMQAGQFDTMKGDQESNDDFDF